MNAICNYYCQLLCANSSPYFPKQIKQTLMNEPTIHLSDNHLLINNSIDSDLSVALIKLINSLEGLILVCLQLASKPSIIGQSNYDFCFINLINTSKSNPLMKLTKDSDFKFSQRSDVLANN